MTPKEKATELLNNYKRLTDDSFAERYCNAKECATIAADEALEEIRDYGDYNFTQERLSFWNNVKIELNKL